MDAFLQGILAGFGIAIPVGAIAILIIETGLRQGFWAGFAAGAGAASADLAYALLAALAGQALAAALLPYALGLRVASALVLMGLGGWGLFVALRKRPAEAKTWRSVPPAALRTIYARFVGLTLLNPLTVTYFAVLILGGSGNALPGWGARAAFVFGAGLASLAWQSLLAAAGALGHRHLSPRAQRASSLVGNLIVFGLGVRRLF